MKKGRNIFNTKQLFYSILMLLSLAWLTVCLPYVYESQQKHYAEQKLQDKAVADNSNPLANTTEEKVPNGVNSLSEYLHDTHVIEQHFIVLISNFNHHNCDVYLAFHPEKVSPPPKV